MGLHNLKNEYIGLLSVIPGQKNILTFEEDGECFYVFLEDD